MPFNDRSAFAKFRCGVAPTRLETGRYENLKLKERHCPVYSDFRNNFFTEVLKVNRNFMSLSDCQKMVFLFSNQDVFRIVAKTCNFILKKRNEVLYCK